MSLYLLELLIFPLLPPRSMANSNIRESGSY